MVTAALLAVGALPVASAGSSSAPEISDAENDVSPASFAANTPQNASLFANLTMYDVLRSWVGIETADDFWLFVEVKDLPDGWGVPADPPDESPFGSNATFVGTSIVANFSVASQTYRAVFKLHMPEPGSIMDNYTVWRSDGSWASVSGAYNTSQDWIAMHLPKAMFVGLADGIHLTNFWVLGRFGNHSMDFAPNARDPATGSLDPLALAKKLAAGQPAVTPSFGSDYVFGQYYHPPGDPGYSPSALVPAIDLAIVGDESRMIDAGAAATFQFEVSNDASATDTVFLSLSSAAAGWSHQLSDVEIQLPPEGAKMVFLTVSAADGADEPLRSVVQAASRLGGADSVAFLTVLQPHDEAPPTDDELPHYTDLPPADDKGLPGFELVLVALAALGVARFRRRN
ncbi:MAG: hypothetical protein HYT80_08325 [Euryarchaeota archaeon]|nr:hypothetical protein [Euryarchaeota archaeon]